jgi:hypothetical protein
MAKPAKRGFSALHLVQRYYPQVEKVNDALESLEIEVKESDAKGGKKKSPNSCALAKACERSYDGAVISTTTAYLIKGKTATRYKLNQSVSREIVSFDRHEDFQPGIYGLRRPSKLEKLGADQYRNPEKTGSQKKKARLQHRTAGIRSL